MSRQGSLGVRPTLSAGMLLALLLLLLFLPGLALAQGAPPPDPWGDAAVSMANEVRDTPVSTSLRIVLLLTALSFLPAAVLVMTPFTRFVIVFSVLRQALGLQQTPPNQVLIGLALFLSLLVMQPQMQQISTEAVKPFMDGHLTTALAIDKAVEPMREFMLENTRRDDMAAILAIGKIPRPESLKEIPTSAVVSAFVLSELKTSFIISFKIFLPFLVVDLIVATVLMGMGMMMVPPTMMSLPFKLLLFILMDGWNLLLRSMASGFGG